MAKLHAEKAQFLVSDQREGVANRFCNGGADLVEGFPSSGEQATHAAELRGTIMLEEDLVDGSIIGVLPFQFLIL